MTKVLILLNTENPFDRGLLGGIVRYSRENGPWRFRLLSPSQDTDGGRVCEIAREWGADAIIGRLAPPLPEKPAVSTVLIASDCIPKGYSSLTADYALAGRMAAKFFLKRGFSSFAFYAPPKAEGSGDMLEGFRGEVEASGFKVLSSECPGNLKHILPPGGRTAIACCGSDLALSVAEACLKEGIGIPGDVSILSVGGDPLLTELSDPPLSHLEMDVEEAGYLTCRLLERAIRQRKGETFKVVAQPGRIHSRSSTGSPSEGDPYVERAVSFIEGNYASDIAIKDIVAALGISRRNLELRFKKEKGVGVHQYLLRYRTELFRQLLLSSDRGIALLAKECGLKDSANLSRTFKKLYGTSPSQYRNSH